jgi:hypothetical protein
MAEWLFMNHVAARLDRERPGDARFPTLWPSEATAVVDDNIYGQCRRKTFFRYVKAQREWGVPTLERWDKLLAFIKENWIPFDAYNMFTFAQGNLYEDFLIEQAKNIGVYVDDQVPVYIRSHNISGKVDIQIINPDTGKYELVECKSVYGFGGTFSIGALPSFKYPQGKPGEPKDSHVMQLACYHWWMASKNEAYGRSRLVYGDRGTGQHGEYEVWTEEVENGPTKIFYRQRYPYAGEAVETKFTLQDVLDGYENSHIASRDETIPPRDFDRVWDEARLAEIYATGELNKTDSTQYEKVMARRAENAELVAIGEKPKQELKQLVKGDWQCNYCNAAKTCYTDLTTGAVRDLSEYEQAYADAKANEE